MQYFYFILGTILFLYSFSVVFILFKILYKILMFLCQVYLGLLFTILTKNKEQKYIIIDTNKVINTEKYHSTWLNSD